ncbi:aminotransferase class I/II-fold pyridoxal phosphate-dependent enzyme [Cohnella candidum]|uniref:Aminotransferase class I/II-fold pyridoxal phosphate-dependent enzyme n=1 Tax=Cohnella candidum TaxID=2674991 RepID=A0A3G3K232_9BACL|nr:aminotransferase class I/II-fold pyridoxal phosphate-dependent enzyme [Cohnella candidum]AYQ74584.1 aminotransferase class I/II-fold pyridoxal phosphate-dependent enzyme [Cohnella candidum]
MRTDKAKAPIYEMLAQQARLSVHSFHVPGHKGRATWSDTEADDRFRELLALDLTELADTDDLHHPQGPIEEAQILAADCFGAEETRFVVGGSTAGNLAMILGTASPGELLIVQRNVHRSVLHGLMLAGVRAVLLQPEIDELTGLAIMPSPERIAEAVARYPEAKGVVLCSPNYYGMCGDLEKVVSICHSAGMPVLADEAHGPHFGFHPRFPESALFAGADVVVQSAHKILSAMTMGAMLHMQGSLVDREAIRQALRMVQSSSPSFPLLASLDLARRQLHVDGESAFQPALEAADRVLEFLPATPFRAIGQQPGNARQDPLKLVLYDTRGTMDGFRLRDELAERGCIAEMADSRHVVLALGTGTRPEDAEALNRALSEISELVIPQSVGPNAIPDALEPETEEIPQPVAFRRSLSATERIGLETSVGRIAGEWIVPYPPGIPELYPGERITEHAVARLFKWRSQGAQIQGAEDPMLNEIRVEVEK